MLKAYVKKGETLASLVIDPAVEPPAAGTAVWYDLIEPTAAEDTFVEGCLGVSIPTRAEMQDIEPSARLYSEEGAEFLTITAIVNSETEQPVKTQVTFIIHGNQLVTLRYANPKAFAIVERNFCKPAGRNGVPSDRVITAEKLMAALLDIMTDRLAQLLETTGDAIDKVSHDVFHARTGNARRRTRDLQHLMEEIGRFGDTLSLVRESLVSINRLTTYHQSMEGDLKMAKDRKQDIKIVQRDAIALADHANFLSNKITFLLDATLGLINLEQNAIIKIFSVAAVVFLPPTLVASIYGMNFKVMPELNWPFGYPMALGLMVLSAALPYLFFKRKGWL
ncbi:MAG: magnesium transporter CorA family protein [Devosia sp.]